MTATTRTRRSRTRAGTSGRWSDWSELPEQELLALRICDLALEIEGTALAARLDALHAEFEAKGLRMRPYAWLSSDWFTPDDATGFAIPFFLAHPRLARLERKQMLEVEGGTHEWCMKLLRHEAGHAVDNAYRLHARKSWREHFGRFSTPYLASYTPDPGSRNHVLNLDYWYAQSHPVEDYAETFACWLDPASGWRSRYATWPALSKLLYVDRLMEEARSSRPVLRTRHREEPVSSLRITLAEYYRRKRGRYDEESCGALDAQLQRAFPREGLRGGAASFLHRNRRKLVRSVASNTAQQRYLIDHALKEMILRCRLLHLRLDCSEREALLQSAVLLTCSTMQFLYGGHPRYHR